MRNVIKLILLSFLTFGASISGAAIAPPTGTCEFNGQTIPNDSRVTAYQNSSVPAGSSCVSEQRLCVDGVLYGSYQYASCSVAEPASCLFNGQTIAHGDAVTAYTASTVAFGVSCSTVAQTRTCNNGVLSGNAPYSSCESNAPRSCLFNGLTVSHGNSVNAFQSSTTQYGGSCTSETRTCNDGTLSGSFQFETCNVDAPASCMFDGRNVAHGEVVTAFASSSAPYGELCQQESRTCDNGNLSGSYNFSSCTVGLPASCTFDGRTIMSGESVTAFQSSSVPYGQSCQSQARTCTNGVLSGSYSSSSCEVEPAASCSINGQTVAHNSSITLYVSSSVAYGQTCQSEQRQCNNGVLSGSATNASCTVQPAASCNINGTNVAHNSSITLYMQSSVPYGQTCQSEQRQCIDGSLTGSATYASCTVEDAPPAASCTLNGQTIPSGQSVVVYQSSSVPYGQTCASQTRTCTNGVLSGSYTSASCSVQAAASCSINGQTIASGQSIVTYQSSSVPYGETCASQTRVCTNGVLSGSYTSASCSVQPAANCTLNGKTIASGSSITVFKSSSVPYGQTCQSETRICTNGVLSGSATAESCVVSPKPPVEPPCPIKNIIWEFPDNCHGKCGKGNNYFKSRVSRDGGKTWTTLFKNRLPADLQEIWNHMTKKYGTNRCGRPNVVYVPSTHRGYVVMRTDYLPSCNTCKFVEVINPSPSRHQCSKNKKKPQTTLQLVCEKK